MKSIILFICQFVCFYFTHFLSNDKIPGEYFFYNKDSTIFKHLMLNENCSYYYENGNDLLVEKSSGKWNKIGDTVFLNSYIQEDTIDVIIDELIIKDCNQLEFNLKNYSNKNNLQTAIVLFGDSIQYINVTSNNIRVRFDKLKSFQIILSNTIKSKKYFLKNERANNFIIDIPNVDLYNNYLFMKNKKNLFQKGNLYPLNNDNRMDSILFDLDLFEPIELTKN